MDKQLFKNPQGSFPLSTDAVDFMQNQILLVEKLTTIFGRNVMIKLPQYHGSSAPSENGLMIFDGELVEVSASIDGFSNITKLDLVEKKVSINALGEIFSDVRILHHVAPRKAYTGTPPNHTLTTPYPGTIKTISYTDCIKLDGIEIASLIKPAYEERVPKGAIIMWSGSWNEIPTGYRLCNGSGTVNGVVIPDLLGKFIVGGDSSDPDFDVSGKTGGSKTHTLSIEEMPSHTHTTVPISRGEDPIVPFVGATGNGNPDGATDSSDRTEAGRNYCRDSRSLASTGGGQPFKHLPPYYVLAFIIKVI